MEPTAPHDSAPQALRTQPQPASHEVPAPSAPSEPRLDLSRMEPPRRLAEARLEEVTIDGICGVY